MPRPTRPPATLSFLLAALSVVPLSLGCSSSAPPPSPGGGEAVETTDGGSETEDRLPSGGGLEFGPTDPDDLTSVPLMTEIDGIEIPRLETAAGERVVGGEVEADEFNDAVRTDDRPVRGGGINVRFNAEPKTLNPITETSAYQSYIQEYFHDALFIRDPETFEWEPCMASACVTEDSVKLRADYPGYGRALKMGSAAPAASVSVTIADDPEAGPQTATVVDGDVNAVGGAWVGLYESDGDEPVAHFFAGDDGVVTLAYEPGTYTARPGAELFGVATTADDGTVTVTPESPSNPLGAPITLDADDVVDIQKKTVFTFTLRDDVTWSDGERFTSRDLEFAYAVINNPFVDGDSLRTYYAEVVAVDAIDELTCRVQYRTQYFKAFEFAVGLGFYSPPFHYFANLLAEEGKTLTLDPPAGGDGDSGKSISARGPAFGKFFNTDDRYNRAPLGVGAYRVADWEDGNKLDLVRRDDYWNAERAGYLERITYKFIDDNVTALQALRGGQIDFSPRLTPEQYFEELTQPSEKEWLEPSYVKAQWYYPAFSYVGWNLRRPVFQDRRVRLALRLLFDVEEYVEKKLYDAGVLVSGSQYIFGPAYDQDVKPIAYDPETARDLLADAGWIDTDGDGLLDKGGEPLQFSLLMPSGSDAVRAQAALLQKRFKDAGIRMDVQELEWASFLERIQGKDFDASRLSWAMSLESDPYQIWHSSGAAPEARSSNAISFDNPVADALIEKIRLTLDEEERMEYMHAFHRILDAEQPYMFLYTPQELGVYAKKFRGVKFYALRPGYDLREWYIPKDLQ